MLAALALAACPWMPAFGLGPACTPAAQLVECQCTECMTWQPTAEVVREYRVWRAGGEGTRLVGILREVVGDDGRLNPPTVWCFAKDAVMPREGVSYAYWVRACDERGCSPSSNVVNYKGAPYAVDQFQPPVVSNP